MQHLYTRRIANAVGLLLLLATLIFAWLVTR
jgi:hypothetical protein